jgi:hypothetical protein
MAGVAPLKTDDQNTIQSRGRGRIRSRRVANKTSVTGLGVVVAPARLIGDYSDEVVNGRTIAATGKADKGRFHVNLCGKRPNNTSDFDTIGHAPAAALW